MKVNENDHKTQVIDANQMVTSSDFEKAVSEILGELEPAKIKAKVIKAKICDQSVTPNGEKVLVHDERDLLTLQAHEFTVEDGSTDKPPTPANQTHQNLNLDHNSGNAQNCQQDQETEDEEIQQEMVLPDRDNRQAKLNGKTTEEMKASNSLAASKQDQISNAHKQLDQTRDALTRTADTSNRKTQNSNNRNYCNSSYVHY